MQSCIWTALDLYRSGLVSPTSVYVFVRRPSRPGHGTGRLAATLILMP